MAVEPEDYAAMLAELEERMARGDIADALGVDEGRLDEIASGYVPEGDVARRLEALTTSGPTAPTGRTTRIPRRAIIVFVLVDAVFFVGVAVFVLARF